MVKLLKRAIITEYKKYHNVSLTVASTSGVVVLKKSWTCWEEWPWTCRTLAISLV